MQKLKVKAVLRAFFASIFLLSASTFASAQTSPNLTFGQVLTPAQWNQLFINKQDTLGFTPLNLSGGVMGGRLVTAPSSATTSGFNLTPGTAGASPANGDLWITSSGFYAQVNGVTIGPIGGATSSSFAATSPITLSFPSGVVTYACPTCGVTGSPLSQFAATTSAQLAGVISNETGTGLLVFGTAPTLITPVLGVAGGTSLALGGASIGGNALAVTGTSLFNSGTTFGAAITYGGVTFDNTVTGTGSLVGSIAPTITGHPTIEGITSTGATGTGAFVFGTGPSISSPTITTAFTATGLVTYADMATAAIATSAQIISGAANVLVPTANIYSAETTTTFGATTTFDFSTFINTAVTLTGNITTMTLSNIKAGQAGQIRFIQDATGSRTTVWNNIFKFTGGVTPALSTAASAIDVLFYSCVSSSLCYAGLNQNMK